MRDRVHNLTYLSMNGGANQLETCKRKSRGSRYYIYRLYGTLGNGINRPTIKDEFHGFLLMSCLN